MGSGSGAIQPSTRTLYEPDVPFEKATFGMGCFWKSESLYGCVKGVLRTTAAYAGGSKKDPTYRSLSAREDEDDESDYTEVVRIEYDPRETSFRELLKLFWPNHDPTREHVSREYMSIIFCHNDAQENEAQRSLKENQKNFSAPIVTKILKLEQYHLAEQHHQKYRLQRQTALYKSLLQSGMKDVTRSHVATRLNGYVSGYGTMAAFDAECNQLGLSSDQIDAVRALIRKGRPR
ncbi:peptide methionine sulfoxide reductase isoform X2 [Rhipicephalus microplus]|uniref:peptide methionine sulfoxide reductase isoform X2 n=1 Tax=Rhipicephalus microplus TaxID=6941 RepID=UPI003F6D00AC